MPCSLFDSDLEVIARPLDLPVNRGARNFCQR
ncbi:Uncharacterised protein [Mycobacteroides abscessus subsp. abscessus]|nr:Uncharacterised protein [Mycobacteroides abscessus subsp. abscessus]